MIDKETQEKQVLIVSSVFAPPTFVVPATPLYNSPQNVLTYNCFLGSGEASYTV